MKECLEAAGLVFLSAEDGEEGGPVRPDKDTEILKGGGHPRRVPLRAAAQRRRRDTEENVTDFFYFFLNPTKKRLLRTDEILLQTLICPHNFSTVIFLF